MTNAPELTGIAHRHVNLGQIDMHVAEVGTGPAVLFLHGFPSLWLTWRHQITAMAEAGYRAIAPDQRGYGDTSVPSRVQAYDIEHLSGDVVRLLDALNLEQAVVVGHDWGALVAWYTALLHPDRVRAVTGVSVPFVPRTPVPPTQYWRETLGEDFYMLWLQEPGVAEALFDADVERALNGRRVQGREAWLNGPATDRLTYPLPRGPGADRLAEAERLDRTAELVPQLRPQLGASGPLRRPHRRPAVPVHRR